MLESHYLPGGVAHAFDIEGYRFVGQTFPRWACRWASGKHVYKCWLRLVVAVGCYRVVHCSTWRVVIRIHGDSDRVSRANYVPCAATSTPRLPLALQGRPILMHLKHDRCQAIRVNRSVDGSAPPLTQTAVCVECIEQVRCWTFALGGNVRAGNQPLAADSGRLGRGGGRMGVAKLSVDLVFHVFRVLVSRGWFVHSLVCRLRSTLSSRSRAVRVL